MWVKQRNIKFHHVDGERAKAAGRKWGGRMVEGGDTEKFMGDDSSYKKKSEVAWIIMDITHMDMRTFLEWFIYPVSLCWRKQIFPLPAGVSDSLVVNLYSRG